MDKCNCSLSWRIIPCTSSSSCSIHNKTFLTGSNCPFFLDSEIVPLTRHMETIKPKKNFKILKINSIDDINSKKEWDKINSRSFASAKSTNKVVSVPKMVVTSKRLVVNLHEKGCNQKDIADELGVSQQYVSKILNSLKLGSDKRQRFHNLSLTFNATFNFWQFPESEYKTIPFGHTHYKNWDNGDFHIQIFTNGRILVRYNRDVLGLKIFNNKEEAFRRMSNFLDEWNKPFGVRFISYVESTKHNAFINHPTAKVFKEKFGREMCVRNDGGKIILLTDNSHNDKELEYPDNETCVPLSEHRENYEKDLVSKEAYFPSEVKVKLDEHERKFSEFMNVLDEFKRDALIPLTAQLKLHLGVESKQDVNMDKMNVVLTKIESKIDNLSSSSKVSDEVSPNIPCPIPSLKTISKYDVERKEKIKRFIKEYGW